MMNSCNFRRHIHVPVRFRFKCVRSADRRRQGADVARSNARAVAYRDAIFVVAAAAVVVVVVIHGDVRDFEIVVYLASMFVVFATGRALRA